MGLPVMHAALGSDQWCAFADSYTFPESKVGSSTSIHLNKAIIDVDISQEIVRAGLISYRILLCRTYIYISHTTFSFTSVWLSTIPVACDICIV
jgi:hypothetical protein